MTVDEAMAQAAQQLDAIIDRQLVALEAQIRVDIAASEPDDDVLDRPPDPDTPADHESGWRRITIEEALMYEHIRLKQWRDQALLELRPNVEQMLKDEADSERS